MFCSNCGKEIRDNSNFCPYCGVVKRAIPSETVKQTPVQDTSASTKKNGSKAFKFCSNCGKVIGQNSDFCPYCGSVKRTIPSKTVEQALVQNTSVVARQNRFKDFWKRRSSEERSAMVIVPLLLLSIICIIVCFAIKNRDYVYIDTLAATPEKFVGRDIRIEGWIRERSNEERFFAVYLLSSGGFAVAVDGRILENFPEDGDAVAVRGKWVTDGEFFWLEADEVNYLDYLDQQELLRRIIGPF